MAHSSDSYNLLSAEAFANPYPIYGRMRSETPVYWYERFEAWVLTRYDDVKTMLDHLEMLVVSPVSFPEDVPTEQQAKQQKIAEFLGRWVIYQNPPRQTVLRQLLSQGYKAITIRDLRPRIQAIADELLDELTANGEEMDVIWDFSFPFAVTVIAEILGVPSSDRYLFKAWALKLRDANIGYIDDPELIDEIDQIIDAAKSYLSVLVAERRQNLGGDLTSGLVRVQEDGRMLEDEELLSNLLLLLFGGQETTMHMIGNGLLALLKHPDQCQMLKENPGLIEIAVEEFLRYESPGPLAMRITGTDLTLGGQVMCAGQKVFGMVGAANRDPAHFPEPDRLDITRQPNRHLAFGHGVHFCLGAALARLEGQIVFPTLLRRLPQLRLGTEDLDWCRSIAIRGTTTLPVVFKLKGY